MSDSSSVGVRRATSGDHELLASVLADAFREDPVFMHLLPLGIRRREARLRRFFDLEVPRSVRLGGAWVSTDGAGAAIWYPPAHWKPSQWQDLRQAPATARIFGRQLARAKRVQAELRRHHPQSPHWYLYYLGARPGRQNAGIGTALLRPMLETCDNEGLPAYLEATSPRNRALYRRHGFLDGEPLGLPDGGPPMYPMWRRPG
jgi:GNAT superfamily N-acetyltransferase